MAACSGTAFASAPLPLSRERIFRPVVNGSTTGAISDSGERKHTRGSLAPALLLLLQTRISSLVKIPPPPLLHQYAFGSTSRGQGASPQWYGIVLSPQICTGQVTVRSARSHGRRVSMFVCLFILRNADTVVADPLFGLL